MTEAEWDACADPTPMLKFLRDKASERKLRLFACACLRSVWPVFTDGRSRAAVETLERYADGAASADDLRSAWRGVDEAEDAAIAAGNLRAGVNTAIALKAATRTPLDAAAALLVSRAAAMAAVLAVPAGDKAAQEAELHSRCGGAARLIREIFGNPFNPAVDPAWLSWNDGAIHKMAQLIYDDRAFDRLPLLADALEDAGCADADILAHCRGPGPHVRGCWAVDLLLGKE